MGEKIEFDESILEIAETISSSLGETLDISSLRWIPRPDGKEQIADSTLALMIDGKAASDDIVLLLSNERFPNVVHEDLARAKAVANLVDTNVGKHVAKPVYEGTFGSQTFAAFSRLSPISENRLMRLSQKHFAAPRIVSWSASLASQTQTRHDDSAAYKSYFIDPLEWINSDTQTPLRLRDFASFCLEELSKSKKDLWTTVEHGDFWIGNALFERGLISQLGFTPHRFTVVDWRGSRDDGYPCADVIRLIASIYKTGSKRSDMLLRQYQNQLNLSNFDVALYATLSLGRLSKNLDHFPRDRFNVLCEKTFDFLQTRGSMRTN